MSIRGILSPVLFHANLHIRQNVLKAIDEINGYARISSDQFKANLIEYHGHYLNRVLTKCGICLECSHSMVDEGACEFRGHLLGRPVICRAAVAIYGEQDFSLSGKLLVQRSIKVLLALISCDRIVKMQMYIDEPQNLLVFYVVDHNWNYPSVSRYLLDDLQGEYRVRIKDKFDISCRMIQAVSQAYQNGVFLRSICASSFLIHESKVIFCDVDAARQAKVETKEGLVFTGKNK